MWWVDEEWRMNWWWYKLKSVKWKGGWCEKCVWCEYNICWRKKKDKVRKLDKVTIGDVDVDGEEKW